MLRSEKGSYAGYLGMKIVMAVAASVAVGILTVIVVLILLIPVGGFGVVAVILGKTAGLTWNLYTITLAVVVGCIVLAVLLYVMALISVPAIVFFPAYSIYFFASRYLPLDALLHPPPIAASVPLVGAVAATGADGLEVYLRSCVQEKRLPIMHLMIK